MEPRARIEVDFHLKADPVHTLASTEDLCPRVAVTVGDVVVASDGEIARLAVVDQVDDEHGTVLLRVLWDEAVPA